MASKMKVDDLRAELSKRGLSIDGAKLKLVKRLESAIRKENKESRDGVDADAGTTNAATCAIKREREDENEDEESSPNGSVKICAADKFREMGVKELREQAALRGILSNGSKKRLIERLCAVVENENAFVADDNDGMVEQEEKVIEECKMEKLVTATKKGAAVLDQWLPDHIKNQYHVLQLVFLISLVSFHIVKVVVFAFVMPMLLGTHHISIVMQGDEIYDAMLNQTNVGHNNNKFYVIQALESDDAQKFMLYNRWGRVGIKGQDKLFGPYSSRESVIQEFEQKFLSKTKNHWSDRKYFVSYPRSYTWLEMDYNDKDGAPAQEKACFGSDNKARETKLESHIAKFISLICNISMMKQQMMEIGYNAEKLPLGKLSKSTILKGYDALKRIAEVMGQSDRKSLEQLSGLFYTVIPHDFGFKKMREFVIDTPQKLKSKLEMVEALGEIELATKLLKDDLEMQEDPLYSQYQRLHCELIPLEADSEEFCMVNKYLKNTHAKTHSQYEVDIVQVFRVKREGESKRFREFSGTKNRMLLWHGSRLTNWAGILSQGLRIAPPEAPVTGYMFGKGVYFADMFSKSANYCFATHAARDGVLLLCEVALGEMEELLSANYNADKLPEGKLSTKGVGATTIDLSEAQVLDDGVIVPLGKPVEQARKGSLLYNEYIVYNVNQIRMRYVLHVNFSFRR